MKQVADLSETSIAVMEFPLILIGSYGLITFSQRVKMYRARLILEKKITPISDKRLSSYYFNVNYGYRVSLAQFLQLLDILILDQNLYLQQF